MKTTKPTIKSDLLQHPDSTAAEIRLRTGISESAIRRNLNRMYILGEVSYSGWPRAWRMSRRVIE